MREAEIVEIVFKRFKAVLFVKVVEYYQDVLLNKKIGIIKCCQFECINVKEIADIRINHYQKS